MIKQKTVNRYEAIAELIKLGIANIEAYWLKDTLFIGIFYGNSFENIETYVTKKEILKHLEQANYIGRNDIIKGWVNLPNKQKADIDEFFAGFETDPATGKPRHYLGLRNVAYYHVLEASTPLKFQIEESTFCDLNFLQKCDYYNKRKAWLNYEYSWFRAMDNLIRSEKTTYQFNSSKIKKFVEIYKKRVC